MSPQAGVRRGSGPPRVRGTGCPEPRRGRRCSYAAVLARLRPPAVPGSATGGRALLASAAPLQFRSRPPEGGFPAGPLRLAATWALLLHVTSQDKTPVVIRKAMAKHNLDSDRPEDYELIQIISEDRELKIPDNANVFYAMNSGANYDFVLKKRGFSKTVKIKHGSSSTLPRMKQKGLKIAKGIF